MTGCSINFLYIRPFVSNFPFGLVEGVTGLAWWYRWPFWLEFLKIGELISGVWAGGSKRHDVKLYGKWARRNLIANWKSNKGYIQTDFICAMSNAVLKILSSMLATTLYSTPNGDGKYRPGDRTRHWDLEAAGWSSSPISINCFPCRLLVLFRTAD